MLRYSLLLLVFVVSAIANGQKSQFYRLLDRGGQELLDGKIPEAKQSLERALRIMPPDLSLEEQSIFYNNLGVVYYQTGEYKKGIDWYVQELKIYLESGNDSLVAGALYNLGLVYKEIGLYKKAMGELIRAARIFERLNNQKELSSAWSSIGNIQRDLGNFRKALLYHERALQLREAIHYTKGIADSYHNIGDAYLALKDYKKAESYLSEALKRKKQLDNQSNIVNTLSLLGKLYVAMGDSKKAYAYLAQAYAKARNIGNSPKIAESICYLATYYGSIGNRAKAIELFHRAEAIARSSSDWQLLRDALGGEIALSEKEMPASELVLKYHQLLDAKEKVAANLNSKELARLEISYDVERKNDELKLRRKQASIDHLRNQRLTGGLAAVGGIALFAGIAFYQARRRKRQAELQKDEIIHLNYELSHRTKNYFGLLSGILKSDKKKAANKETERVLDVNIHRLEAMSLVHVYLLSNSTQAHKKVQLDAYLDHLITELLLNLFPGKEALKVDRDLDTVFLDYDKAMRVAIVLNELICNAIEHGLADVEKPVLRISLRRFSDRLILKVSDNGPGLSEAVLQSKSVKGRDLVTKLLHTIDGTIVYRNENGCTAEVTVMLK